MERRLCFFPLFLSLTVILALAGCKGGTGSPGATGPAGPTMPVIQSLYATGVPAAPGSTVTAVVTAQSAENLDLAYSWSVSAGWTIASGGTTTTVTITAPNSRGASGTATVIVTDSGNRTATGAVALSTGDGNAVPAADAGPDRKTAASGIPVALDGSASADPDGDALTYAWSFTQRPVGSTATLSSPIVSNPTFTPDKAGTYELSLTVNDGQTDSAPDTVTIRAGMPLPDTGQTRWYSTAFGDDGDYTINPMSYRDNGDGTIFDTVTGLTWQKCCTGQSGPDCATGAVDYYNWYQATGTYDAVYNFTTTNVCGSLNLAGTGWRLPTDLELMTIVDYGTASPEINTAYFPNTQVSLGYWSSSVYAAAANTAWYVSFASGFTNFSNKVNGLYVRCVRDQ